MMKDTPLIFDGKELSNRLFLGTGKFKSKKDVAACIESSGTQVVTVALRRIDLNSYEDNILEYVPEEINLMVNTSGARNAVEALRIARIAKDAGYGNWIKVEVINDSKYLLPDNNETVKATELLVKEGFIAFPYITPDLYVARALVKAGAAAVMPLGSFIGSNRGVRAGDFIRTLIDEIEIPVIVDAGIGVPSHAAQAMEMGASAVLVNTAIATAADSAVLAKAFSLAVEAGRMAYIAKPPAKLDHASASSPLTGFLFKDEK